MKILMATPILFDGKSPFNHLLSDMLEGFLEAGHKVTRLVAVESEADSDYRMGISSDRMEYVPFVRKRADKSNIILRYLRDSLMNIRMARAIRRSDADLLFEDVSYSSFWAVRAAKKRGMRVVAMLQDIWPDNAVQSGLLREGSLVYRYFEWWQRRVYRKADRFVCISEDMKAFLAEKGVPAEKIDVIYNWGYSDETVDIPWEENEFVRANGLQKDLFYAVYAGNIGRMQNVELIVRAAEALKEEEEKIRFLIIGDGVRREAIEEMVREKGLSNVTMLPMQKSELATSIYSAAGINIIPLVPGGVKTALPSKTGVVLSCGRPAVFCFDQDSKFAATVDAAGCGYVVSAEEPDGLCDCIRRCAQTPPEAYRQGCYRLFQDCFVRSENVKRYLRALEQTGVKK